MAMLNNQKVCFIGQYIKLQIFTGCIAYLEWISSEETIASDITSQYFLSHFKVDCWQNKKYQTLLFLNSQIDQAIIFY